MISIARSSSSVLVYKCTEINHCHGHGVCLDEECQCIPGWSNKLDCSGIYILILNC